MNGRLTIWVDGREALPVRAIPYVAGPRYEPKVIAESFAGITRFSRFQTLTAFHLSSGSLVEMLPREWDFVCTALDAFAMQIRAQRPDIAENEDVIAHHDWDMNAVGKLPAGVFVWLDEFEREFAAERSRVLHADIRKGDDTVHLSPHMDDATLQMVFDGFTYLEVDADDAESKLWTKNEWERQARAIGEEWMHDQERLTGDRPTVVEIAQYLEGELSTRGITGARGGFLYSETIRREALTGITGRKKGENFKNAKGSPQRKRRSPNAKGQ